MKMFHNECKVREKSSIINRKNQKMKRLRTTIVFFCCCFMTTVAQNIDFDFPGRQSSEVTETNYTSWPIGRVTNDSMTLPNGISITIAPGEEATALASNWSKNIVKQSSKLLGDGVFACHLDNGNYQWITEGKTAIILTITGLSEGEHSLLAYHNDTDGGQRHPNVEVSVDGVVKGTGFFHSSGALRTSASGISYVEFSVTEGQPVVIQYTCVPEPGETYQRTSIMINGLEFDTNPYGIMDPMPANYDYHVATDNLNVSFSWVSANDATSHRLYLGTDSTAVASSMTPEYEGSAPMYYTSGFSPLVRYWWRVDEQINGEYYKGKVMAFQTRRDAFPGAEGYGRYAIGGRGGSVYHVTTLEDNGDDNNPIEGSFRYAIKKAKGPRTIVFDVAGVISLKSRLTCADKYVTVAGQTAPGNGIMLRTCPFGMQSDGITRFIRMRLGHKKLINNVIPGGENGYSYGDEEGTTEETTLGGLDGMGMAGNDNSIMDHCSISWTIDEAFSSRNAKGLTLQHSLISEALNQAGHPNYSAGTRHGYAATIGGGEMGGNPGSYHHNLLAHCEGRNWSISGGLDGKGAYDGHHDIYNNVVYNYGSRATDGGTHEMNFCNNYYKMGANSTSMLMNLQLEGTGTGTQSVHVSGNIRQAKNNGALTQDKKGTTYKYSTSGGQQVDWDPLPAEPFSFINPENNMETAQAAYKNVLSDVGCTLPFFDNHDQRMIRETIAGSTSTKGSRSGRAGLIDSEEDAGCEGFDLEKLGIINAQRDSNWDTDQDGIPNWFEEITGTNPSIANNNEDRDGDYYTDLEEYLNWIAIPNFLISGQQDITLSNYFAGYDSPSYEVTTASGVTAVVNSGVLSITPTASAAKLFAIKVKATEDDITLERTFHFAFAEGTTGIVTIQSLQTTIKQPFYDLSGRCIAQPTAKGIYIHNGKKLIIK